MNDENPPEVLHQVDLSTLPKPTLTHHQWRQYGTQLVCRSCSAEHATFIDPGYQLTGIDANGYPVIKPVVVKP